MLAPTPPGCPLGHEHVDMLGRYSFRLLRPGAGLRPLRDPEVSGEDG